MKFVGGATLGGIVGAVLGFLLRPAAPLIGQLPIGVVLTRGEFLNGLDVLFKSTAEQSFNYMLFGAILGAILLGLVSASWKHDQA
jgi:hypothetical protein